MTRKGFALVEAIVTLFVVAVVGIALLDLVVMARRLHGRRQQSAYIQGLLNSALAQTLNAPSATSSGSAENDGQTYNWIGTRTQEAGYRKAQVTLTVPSSIELKGELVRAE